MKSQNNCENISRDPDQEACSSFMTLKVNTKAEIGFARKADHYKYTGENRPMRKESTQVQKF
jgi:hypothetical protein